MPPDAGELVEVGLPQPGPVGVTPEMDRHRRHGCGDDQFADLVQQGLPGRTVGLDIGAECAAGDLTFPDGHGGGAADDAGAQVGAAGEGNDLHLLAEVVGEAVESVRVQG